MYIDKLARFGDTIILMSSDASFREAAEQYLLIATFKWVWRIKGNVASTTALAGKDSFTLGISVDFKEKIEKHLEVLHNDTIFLVYDFLADVEIYQDEEGKRAQKVVEYIVTKYIVNPKTNKAIMLNNEIMEE